MSDKRVRILGIAAQERLSLLPDVPTLAERAFRCWSPIPGTGPSAPRQLPDVVRRLNHEVNEALKSAELKATYAEARDHRQIVSLDEFGVFLKEEAVRLDKWSRPKLRKV